MRLKGLWNTDEERNNRSYELTFVENKFSFCVNNVVGPNKGLNDLSELLFPVI